MAKVVWSPAALDDVDAVAAYIAKDSNDQASLFVNRLLDAVERLGDFPLAGHVIPEMAQDNCRQIIVGAYRVMYRVEADALWITGVIHGARDWPGE